MSFVFFLVFDFFQARSVCGLSREGGERVNNTVWRHGFNDCCCCWKEKKNLGFSS